MERDIFELYILYKEDDRVCLKLVKMFDSRKVEHRVKLILLSCNIALKDVAPLPDETIQALSKRDREKSIASLSSLQSSKRTKPNTPQSNQTLSEPSTPQSSSGKEIQTTLLMHGYEVGLLMTKEELHSSGFEPVYGFKVVPGKRVRDGMEVLVRVVSSDSKELEILKNFNLDALRVDPRNIIVPVLDFIPSCLGDVVYVVMERGEMILNVVSSESLDNFVNFYKIQLSLIEF